MNFYIFDSKFSRKFFISLVLILIVFFTFSDSLRPIFSSSDWRDKNVLRGREFLENKLDKESILLVGSSTTTGVFNIPALNIHNLAIASGSSKDGLDIILKSGKLPKTLFVEVNYTFNNLSTPILEKIYNKRKQDNIEKVFEEKSRLRILQYISIQLSQLLHKLFDSHRSKSMESKIYNEKRNLFYKAHINVSFEQEKIIKNVTEFIDQLNTARKLGVQLYLFKTTMDPFYYNSKMLTFFDSTLHQMLNENNYDLLILEDFIKYQTKDGVHPTPQGSIDIEKILLGKLR